MDRKRNITDLPVEILDLVFDYCGELSNKVLLAQTHPNLLQAFAYHYRNSFKHIYSNDEISFSSLRLILQVCGSNIKTLDREMDENVDDEVELANLIGQHCSNLEKVRLNFDTARVHCVKSLICQTQNFLRAIDLSLSFDQFIVNTKVLDELPELPSLESLKIWNILVDNYYHIQKFKNLVELAIGCFPRYCCSDLNAAIPEIDILALCAPLQKLRILNLRGVKIITSEKNKVHLPEILPLEKLTINQCDISVKFPECFDLNTIEFQDNGVYMSPDPVHQFILSQRKSLESLSYNCRFRLCQKQFLEVIRVCQNLRYFKLPLRSVRLDLDFIKRVVNILKENGVTANNPLVLEAIKEKYCKILQNLVSLTPYPELLRVTVQTVRKWGKNRPV